MRTHALLLLAALSLGCGSNPMATGPGGAGAGGKGSAGTNGALERGGMTGSSPGTAGAAGGAGGAAGAASVAGGADGHAGAGGSVAPVEPPPDISGRWGMFEFEDPVGVNLTEAPDGTLTGEGCAAGAPGSPNPDAVFFCGAIIGKVIGETATFSFPLGSIAPYVVYSARVTISHDRQRMAGDFNAVSGPVGPTAWLRVRWDAPWLDRPRPIDGDPLNGWYALDLMADASVGNEFVAGTAYRLGYFDRSLAGDLGGFWNSEMSDPAQGSPLRVGPVPITVPALPTSLSLDFDGTGLLGVTASTPSGGFYRFSAKRM